jgi:hypothetical protein
VIVEARSGLLECAVGAAETFAGVLQYCRVELRSDHRELHGKLSSAGEGPAWWRACFKLLLLACLVCPPPAPLLPESQRWIPIPSHPIPSCQPSLSA